MNTERERDKILGTKNALQWFRRMDIMRMALWRAWQAMERDNPLYEDTYAACKEADRMNSLGYYLRDMVIPCDEDNCDAPATHIYTVYGFRGDLDYYQVCCVEHIPDMTWFGRGDLVEIPFYYDEDSDG